MGWVVISLKNGDDLFGPTGSEVGMVYEEIEAALGRAFLGSIRRHLALELREDALLKVDGVLANVVSVASLAVATLALADILCEKQTEAWLKNEKKNVLQ